MKNTLVIAAFTLLMLQLPQECQSKSKKQKLGDLKVTGQGQSDIGSHLSKMTLSISKNTECDISRPPDECSAQAIQNEMNSVISPVIKYLSSFEGVVGIQADGLSINQINDRRQLPVDISGCAPCPPFSPGGRIPDRVPVYKTYLTGYEASTSITTIVPMKDVGEIVDKVVGLGVNSVSDIDLYVDGIQLNEAKYDALHRATDNALNQAGAAVGVYDELVIQTKFVKVPFNDCSSCTPDYVEGPAFIGDDAVFETVKDGEITGGIKTISYQVKLDLKTNIE